MAAKPIIELAKKALVDEMRAFVIYQKLARLYGSETVRTKLMKIAEMEGEHVSFWREFLKKRGCDASSIAISKAKIAVFTLVFRLIGLGLTLRLLEMDEREAVELFSEMLEKPELSREEKEKLKEILEDELVHEQEFAEEESRFEEFLAHVRDAVLDMNDGLVEVLSVTSELAGAYGSPFHVALEG